ncbi:MAG TPA: hypothetical protein VMY35_12380 [Phycisphaerae bacterium]|nr:hypothetical protein [Phycisphaerae bacterium]
MDIRSVYEDGVSDNEAKYVRLDYLSYIELDGTPDARNIYYNYGATGGTSDVLNRLDNLATSGTGQGARGPERAHRGVAGSPSD